MNKQNKVQLYGFNNLTKNLSLSLYQVKHIHCDSLFQQYKAEINKQYSSQKLSEILTSICDMIGGNVLNVAHQNYNPQGASVTLMISEEAKPESLVAHLDKSHLCIHTYPEEKLHKNLAIFRADIELSTCGVISPLKVLNYILEEFDSDVVDIDYRIRGMTRSLTGGKLYIDDSLANISEFLDSARLETYDHKNNNLPLNNIFHCKLKRKSVNVSNSIFKQHVLEVTDQKLESITNNIAHEANNLYQCF
jgi:S-adenosylmethionine decarboxylase